MGISHHPGNSFQACYFFRRSLGITAGHQNAALGVPAVDSAHELAHLRVRRGRDCTRIQDGHRALFHARDFLKSGLKQLLLQRGAIGLAGAAAKIENVKRCHVQRRIVAEVRVGRH
jgi:hypothetical protein